jgi:hypothetical protein
MEDRKFNRIGSVFLVICVISMSVFGYGVLLYNAENLAWTFFTVIYFALTAILASIFDTKSQEV